MGLVKTSLKDMLELGKGGTGRVLEDAILPDAPLVVLLGERWWDGPAAGALLMEAEADGEVDC